MNNIVVGGLGSPLIVTGGLGGYAGSPTPTPTPTGPATTLEDFWQSLLAYIRDTEIFGTASVDYADDAEAAAEGLFPTNPPPYCLIQPDDFDDEGSHVGGGRYTKVWTARWTVVVVVRNITDPAYRSTAAVTASSASIGPYVLADQIVNLIEQGWVCDASNHLQLIELPVAGKIRRPARLKKSAEYIRLAIPFTATLCHYLPANLP